MMKILFKTTIIAVVFTTLALNSFAQIINVCGNDTVTLRVGNYQYGTIQWEKSKDTLNWQIIPHAHDTVYKFFPTENMYYRAVGKFASCPPEYSKISYVQKAPVANAGLDRVVNGQEVKLAANKPADANGLWTIISGSGGMLDDATDKNTVLEGTAGQYTLVWTLTNACGTSSDTVKVKFKNNVYSNELIIVGANDTLFSDSTDLANGIYKVKFDSTRYSFYTPSLLLGYTNDGYLRVIDWYSFDNDTCIFVTYQGTLEELTLSGAFNLAQVFDLDSSLTGSKGGNMQRIYNLPTAAELLSNPIYKTQTFYYIIEDETEVFKNGITINKNKNTGALIDIGFTDYEIADSPVEIKLSGSYKFYPNLVADIEIEDASINYFMLGMSNGISESNLQLKSEAQGSATLFESEFTIMQMRKNIIIITGGVPVVIQAEFKLEGSIEAEVSATVNFDYTYSKTGVYNSSIEYSGGDWTYSSTETNNVETSYDFNVNCNLTQEFKIGPKLEFKVYGIAGPYLDAKLKEELNICTHNLNWKAEMDIDGELILGAKAEVLGNTLFDVSTNWEENYYNVQLPFTIEMYSGNNQNYTANNPLPQSVQVKVTSDKGFIVPGALVHFNPGSGSVSDNPAIANLAGIAETLWTPSGSGQSELEAYVTDCEGNHVEYSPITFTAFEIAGGTDCSTSSLFVSVLNDGITIQPLAQMGVPPYTYATDGINFSPVIPIFVPVAGTQYNFTVKDDEGCYAFVSYSSAPNPCVSSDLYLNITTMGNGLVAYASGGTPPYLFSLNDPVNGYSFTSSFSNLTPGSYAVYVKDANDCIKSGMTDITTTTQPVVANFTTSPMMIDKEDTVQFISLSNSATVWLWDFGDGNMSVQENPKHKYTLAGKYTVSLTATNTLGSSVKTKEIHVGCGKAIDADGNMYPSVQIGSQCWMRKNLNVNVLGSYCYDNDTNNCAIYGRLYTWDAAMSACPTGWHLPSESEALVHFCYDCYGPGGIAKETGLAHWEVPNGGATNSTGFTALAGGFVSVYGGQTSSHMGRNFFAWTSTTRIGYPDQAMVFEFHSTDDWSNLFGDYKAYRAFSVRCIKD